MKSSLFVALLLTMLAISACDSMSVHLVRPGSEPEDATVAAKTEASLESVYRALAVSGAGPVFQLDPTKSRVTVFVYRGGAVGDQGHDHVVSIPEFEGYALLPSKLADARLDLQFRLDSMILDNPALRAATGGEFRDPLASSAIEGTREHMLGAHSLQADTFPVVRLHAVAVEGDLPKPILRLAVTLHGQTEEIDVPLTVSLEADALQAQGAFVLRQSNFGITPYSVMHGLLRVQDPLMVEFDLHGTVDHFN